MDMYKNINKEIIEENVKLRQQIDCLRREVVMERQRSVEKNEELVFVKMSYKEKAIELLKFIAPEMPINFTDNACKTETSSQNNSISRSSDESQRFSNNNSNRRSSREIVEGFRHSSSLMCNSIPNVELMSPTRCSNSAIESSPSSAVPSSIKDDDAEESILVNESNTIVQETSIDISYEDTDSDQETEQQQENELLKDQIVNNNELYSITEDSEQYTESLSEFESDSIIDCESSSATLTNEVSQHKQKNELLLLPPLARTPKNSSPLRNVTNNQTLTMPSCKVTWQRKGPPLQLEEEQQEIVNGNTIPSIQIERHAIESCDNMSFRDSLSFLPIAESTPQVIHNISMGKTPNTNETKTDANADDNTLIEFNRLKISNFVFDLDSIESQEKKPTEKRDCNYIKNNHCRTKKQYKTESENRTNVACNLTKAALSEIGSSVDESSNCTRSSRPFRACRPTTLTEPNLIGKLRRNF